MGVNVNNGLNDSKDILDKGKQELLKEICKESYNENGGMVIDVDVLEDILQDYNVTKCVT